MRRPRSLLRPPSRTAELKIGGFRRSREVPKSHAADVAGNIPESVDAWDSSETRQALQGATRSGFTTWSTAMVLFASCRSQYYHGTGSPTRTGIHRSNRDHFRMVAVVVPYPFVRTDRFDLHFLRPPPRCRLAMLSRLLGRRIREVGFKLKPLQANGKIPDFECCRHYLSSIALLIAWITALSVPSRFNRGRGKKPDGLRSNTPHLDRCSPVCEDKPFPAIIPATCVRDRDHQAFCSFFRKLAEYRTRFPVDSSACSIYAAIENGNPEDACANKTKRLAGGLGARRYPSVIESAAQRSRAAISGCRTNRNRIRIVSERRKIRSGSRYYFRPQRRY